MKLRLPSDLQGGLIMFIIMFSIAIIQIYILKNVRAFKASKHFPSSNTEACLEAGGTWYGKSEDDQCCKNPSDLELADDFDLDICPEEGGDDLNTKLGCPDYCFTRSGDKHNLGLEDVPGCEKCPQPRGFGKHNRQGGLF